MKEYRSRVADNVLQDNLAAAGAVLIEGPKWCGKTTTAEKAAASILYLDTPAELSRNLQIMEIDPAQLLRGETPRLIDEWQLAPTLWDTARFEIDHRKATGQFIFTGSAVPADKSKLLHSGTGRFAWLTMRPMSLWESGESSGAVSFEALFSGGSFTAEKALPLSLEQLAFVLCRGGWPGTLEMAERSALRQSFNYLDAVVNQDIVRVDPSCRDTQFARRLIRSYARHQGSAVPIPVIHQDLKTNEGNTLSEDTIRSYLGAMRAIFVIEDMPAWNPNLRSKSAIRTSDTRYFVDASIATAALGIGPKDLVNDLNTFGFLFETMVVRDLRVYANALDGDVFHFRDRNGLECDAVMHLRNGSYGLIEIKIGGESAIEQAVRTLNQLESKIDTDRMPAPTFKMVLTGVGEYAYRRKDGILVAPIASLRL